MGNTRRGALSLAVALVATACAATVAAQQVLTGGGGGAPRPRPVAPGERIGGELLEARAPNAAGWVLAESPGQLVFGHPGAARRESYVALVTLFELPALADSDAFLAFVRGMVEADASPKRVEGIEEHYALTEARGYPCVAYDATGLDTKAPGGPLRQAMHALYCRHPLRPDRGFSAIYSQRAKQIDADLAQQAQAFFDGVRVPTAGDSGSSGSLSFEPNRHEPGRPNPKCV